MASWKKIVTSGSNAELNHITSSGNFEITGNISGSATSTGSFGRVENASGKFRVLGTTAEISSPGLTQLHIFQDGLGTNSNAPSLKIGNNGQGNGYELTLSVGTSGQANFSGNVSSAGSLRGTQFDGVNSRGTAGTALFTATGNGGDGGGMYFGGGGAFDIRFSTTEKERLRIDTEGNGGGIQTSGSLRVGSLTAGATSDITATGNISGSATSTGSFGRVEATKFVGDGSSLTGVSADVVDDTSPQLGGDLDLNSNDITGTGNINITGNISGSATSTGSFGRTEGTSFSYVFDANGSLVYDNDQLVYRNGGNDKFTVDNSQMTTEVVNTGRVKIGGSNKVQLDETSVSLVISNNDGGMQDNLTLTKEGNLTLHRGGLTLAGNAVIGGDLTVNGDTTTISTSNILVQDAFGFFATGSAGTNVDAGIIVQSGSFVDSGSAIYHDISKERWSVGKGIASTATNVPDSKWGGFVATVYTASASPVGSSPKYGVGEIHVDDDGEIYIYS